MYGKETVQYSRLSSDPSRAKGIVQGGITVKNVVLFLGVVVIVIVLLAVVTLALGIAGLGHVTNIITPTVTPPTPVPVTVTEAKPTTPAEFITKSDCGTGLWKQIAFFDMSDPSEQCPRGWRGYSSDSTNGVRCCGRPVTDRSSCPAVFYGTNGYRYSKVCGRAIGYQQGSPDGFASIVNAEPSTETVNGIYVDGVSVTHGNPRTHIWTFAVGVHELGSSGNQHNCPCDGGASPPPFVGNNYFCETGDDTPNVELHRFYYEDPLWDGFDCHNTTCCLKNSPPWFKVQLTGPTTDDIEVRICGDQRTGDEDSPISLLEIYVQ